MKRDRKFERLLVNSIALNVLIPPSVPSCYVSFSAAPWAPFLRGRLHFTPAL